MRDALFVERFQQIIDCIHLECFHRVLIEGGGEYDFREWDFPVEQLLDYAKTVESGHLDVKENEIRVVLTNQVNGFDAILALSHDTDIV